MALRIKAKYVNGTLTPLEPLELEEGTVVTLAIEQQELAGARQHSVVETIDRLREQIGEINGTGFRPTGP
ncbi:MAG: antitoxin family protein [Chloroflexi bacterium]|nr:antitoxin family protein [Chloroflexota bacterium]